MAIPKASLLQAEMAEAVAMAESNDKDGKYWYDYVLVHKYQYMSLKELQTIFSFFGVSPGEPQVKYQVDFMRLLGASLDITTDRLKSNEKASKLRNSGHSMLSSNTEPEKVAEMYTKCLAYAIPGSPEVPLAYANRSAVSLKARNYEDCMLDIERALNTGYPEELRAELCARKLRCLLALGKSRKEILTAIKYLQAKGGDEVRVALEESARVCGRKRWKLRSTRARRFFGKLQKFTAKVRDRRCEIPGATGIAIHYSEKYGRHMRATRDIRPGEIIAVIDNYTIARSPDACYRECSHCAKGTLVGIPCEHCVNAIYCSNDCRSKAWGEYHQLECPVLGALLDLGVPAGGILAMRITLKAIQEAGGVVEVQQMCRKIDGVTDPRVKGFTGKVFDCTKFASIRSLVNRIQKPAGEIDTFYMSYITTFIVYYLATRSDLFGVKYEKGLDVFNKNPLVFCVGGLMLENWKIVQVADLTEYKHAVETEQNGIVSSFVYYCTHSCYPNIIAFGDYKTVAVTLRPIKAGEPIYHNYLIKQYTNLPRDLRQMALKKYYNISCDCVACTEDWPMFEELPYATEILGMPEETLNSILKAEKSFDATLERLRQSDYSIGAKEELVQLLELLYKHACPSKDIIFYQGVLMKMFAECITLF